MLHVFKIAVIVCLLAQLEPDCSAFPHDLNEDYTDPYYASKEEEFKNLQGEFSVYVEHVKSGQELIAAGLGSERCLAAARIELNGKQSKCRNPFEMKLSRLEDDEGTSKVLWREKFCRLLHEYLDCLVTTICQHCNTSKKCEKERNKQFKICTDSAEQIKNRRFWGILKRVFWFVVLPIVLIILYICVHPYKG